MIHCCETPAIPKTSQRGLQFFAHKVSGDCASQAESPEHEFVKFEIAKAVHDFGWHAETEKSGISDKGDELRADVFCSQGNVKIAFEVQNSGQSWSEIEARQKRYAESGVRCAWFLNKKAFKIDDNLSRQSKEIPAFTYKLEGVGIPTTVDFFDMTAGEFAVQLLSKNVHWIDREKYSAVSVCEHACWKCKSLTKSIIGLAGSNFDNGDELSECIKDVKVKVELPRSFMNRNGIGFTKSYKYKNGDRYFVPI